MGNVLQPGNTEQFNQQLEALGLGALVGIMATIMLISLAVSEYMRKKGWIKDGDMKLDI